MTLNKYFKALTSTKMKHHIRLINVQLYFVEMATIKKNTSYFGNQK